MIGLDRAPWAVVAGLLVGGAARAGSGPWTLSQDDRSLYVGADYGRWSRFAGGEGSRLGEPNEIGTAVTRTDLLIDITYGLLPGAEIELAAAYAWSGVSRLDVQPCDTLPLGACRDVSGLAPVNARLKVRLLDEFGGAPLTVALGPSFRFADWTRGDRQRITALGDGQTDLAAFASAGRSGGLGQTWSYAGYLEASYRHRLKIGEVDSVAIPGDEGLLTVEALVYPRHALALGLAAELLHRPAGVDYEATDLNDPDRFTSLSVTALKVGPRLLLRSVDDISVSASAMLSVYARNNPIDQVVFGVGIGHYTPSPARSEERL